MKRDRVPLLRKFASVFIPALGQFSASKEFQQNYGENAKPGVRIYALGSCFRFWFLGKDGVVCKQTDVTLLDQYQILDKMNDDSIIKEFGGMESPQNTTISQVFYLMEQQPGGQEGALLNNGYTNLFYARDKNGMPRVLEVLFRGRGWYIYAGEIDSSVRRDTGDQIFSRNSWARI